MRTFDSWDQKFMTLVFQVASWSKDESTQVGAVIVGPSNKIISVGYNGIPAGVKETPKRLKAPLKYLFTEHAERNAIYQTSSCLENCKMYLPISPCADCARAILTKGIQEIVVSRYWDQILDRQPQWEESIKAGRKMLLEKGVKIRVYKGKIISRIENICSGKPIKF